MWANLGGREVIARQRFRRDEETVGPLDGQEARKKARRELSMPMTHEPHLGQLCFKRTQNREASRARDFDVPLLEVSVVGWLRLRRRQWKSALEGGVIWNMTCPLPESTICARK